MNILLSCHILDIKHIKPKRISYSIDKQALITLLDGSKNEPNISTTGKHI